MAQNSNLRDAAVALIDARIAAHGDSNDSELSALNGLVDALIGLLPADDRDALRSLGESLACLDLEEVVDSPAPFKEPSIEAALNGCLND